MCVYIYIYVTFYISVSLQLWNLLIYIYIYIYICNLLHLTLSPNILSPIYIYTHGEVMQMCTKKYVKGDYFNMR